MIACVIVPWELLINTSYIKINMLYGCIHILYTYTCIEQKPSVLQRNKKGYYEN